MFVGTLDVTGKVPRIEVRPAYADVAEVRVAEGGSVVVLRMTESQLLGLSHQINQHLDRVMTPRVRVVKRQTAPVGGAAAALTGIVG